jgi:hypothetical protein
MIDKPADPEVVAANAAAMDALTNGDGPEPSIPAGAAQTAAKGPQPMGGGFTLDDLTDTVQRLRSDVGGLISRTDQLETMCRRADRQTLMLIGLVSVLMWSVKSIAQKLPELTDAPAA